MEMALTLSVPQAAMTGDGMHQSNTQRWCHLFLQAPSILPTWIRALSFPKCAPHLAALAEAAISLPDVKVTFWGTEKLSRRPLLTRCPRALILPSSKHSEQARQ